MEFGKVWFGEGGNIARLYVVQSRINKKPVCVGTVIPWPRWWSCRVPVVGLEMQGS